jgi:hypothetical protein
VLGDGLERLAAYRALVAAGMGEDTLGAIRANVQQGRAFASTLFQLDHG